MIPDVVVAAALVLALGGLAAATAYLASNNRTLQASATRWEMIAYGLGVELQLVRPAGSGQPQPNSPVIPSDQGRMDGTTVHAAAPAAPGWGLGESTDPWKTGPAGSN